MMWNAPGGSRGRLGRCVPLAIIFGGGTLSMRQVTEIASVLDQLYGGLEQGSDLCASFEVQGEDTWIQLTDDMLNLYWPSGRPEALELEETLKDKLPYCHLIAFEMDVYVTYRVKRLTANEMAALIDWMFREVFDVRDNYRLDTDVYEL
jgi:hypothetical protein